MVNKEFNPSISHPLYFMRKGLYKLVAQHAPTCTGKLLDFGCGAKPYRTLFTNVSEYIGLDYASEGHDHKSEDIEAFYDGKNIPFGNEQFDWIFSSEVFEHVFGLNEILPELNRVLKKGGKMMITTPFAWEEHEAPIDFARYTRFGLTDLFEKNGFKVLTVQKSGHLMMALHQIFIVYFYRDWITHIPILRKWNFAGKVVRQLLVPAANIMFLLVAPFWPKSEKFYLSTLMIIEKNE